MITSLVARRHTFSIQLLPKKQKPVVRLAFAFWVAPRSHVSLMLRKLESSGYVSFPGCSLWFKIPDDVFGAVWNRLCQSPVSAAP